MQEITNIPQISKPTVGNVHQLGYVSHFYINQIPTEPNLMNRQKVYLISQFLFD